MFDFVVKGHGINVVAPNEYEHKAGIIAHIYIHMGGEIHSWIQAQFKSVIPPFTHIQYRESLRDGRVFLQYRTDVTNYNPYELYIKEKLHDDIMKYMESICVPAEEVK